jgi:hypothetical protein
MKDGHLTRIYTLEAADITLRFLFVSGLFPTGHNRFLLSLLFSAVITYTSVIGFTVADVVYRTIVLITFLTYGPF